MNTSPTLNTIANFVVIEGLDGAGTTTLTKRLGDAAGKLGGNCELTFEPTGSAIGRLIRSVLKKTESVTPEALARLFTADRHNHLYGANGIVETANNGSLVICDRYLFSSLAYQSIGCTFETVYELNEAFPCPELTIFLDVPPEICASRRAERNGVELFEHDELQHDILAHYRRAFDVYRKRGADIQTIDGTDTIDTVVEKAWNLIKGLPIFK